jgi:tryptophan synthase beta chain
MAAYSAYFAGNLKDENYSEAELAMALAGLPSVSEAA